MNNKTRRQKASPPSPTYCPAYNDPRWCNQNARVPYPGDPRFYTCRECHMQGRFDTPPRAVTQAPLTADTGTTTVMSNLSAGLALRDEGTARALSAQQSWAARAGRWLAARSRQFTSETLIDAIGLPTGAIENNRNNAVGAIINAWSRRKLIERVGYTKSTRPRSHAAQLAVWIPVKGGVAV